MLAVVGPGRVPELISLSYWLKEQSQEDLASWLRDLSPKEFRIAWGAGIPGDAYYVALELYRAQKARMERAAHG